MNENKLQSLVPNDCPYPRGTEEYFAWWDNIHRQVIEQQKAYSKERDTRAKRLRDTYYGHVFGRECRCSCGMYKIDYLNSHPNYTICPNSKEIL